MYPFDTEIPFLRIHYKAVNERHKQAKKEGVLSTKIFLPSLFLIKKKLQQPKYPKVGNFVTCDIFT